MMRLSQGHLNLLEACPRRFQHIYLEQLSSPVTAEQQARLTWGTRFHRMMQQYALGLPVTNLDPIDPEVAQLQQSVRSLVSAVPTLFAADVDCQSEYRRTWEFQGHLFTVIYDLLLLSETTAQILDWKTYPRPQRSQPLAQNWQTRLYPLVLAATTDYLPEQIVMTYWFVQSEADAEPQSLTYHYSAAQRDRDYQHLTQLLHQLAEWQQFYAQGTSFPQTQILSACRGCSFQRRCQRESDSDAIAPMQSLSEVQEVWL